MPFLVQPLYSLGVPVIIPAGFGHCIWVGLASIVLTSWQYAKLSDARKKYEVPPEITVSDKAIFYSWMYKSYRSTMEIYPHFIMSLTFGGIDHPYLTALFGWIWIMGRWVYAKNYDFGTLLGRVQGSQYQFGHWMCLGFCLKFAVRRCHLTSDEGLMGAW